MKKILIFILSFSIAIFFAAVPLFILSADKIDINTATLEQLDKIIHVGPITAQKIIDGRPYNSIQDLNRVSGIGKEKNLQDIISEGIACVNCATPIIETTSNSEPETILTSEPETSPSPVIYPDGILINEVLPSPEGADEENEWIELYNSNNFEVDISGWKLKDTAGTPKTFFIPGGTKIAALETIAFWRPETKITLNNDGDSVVLLMPNDQVADSISFEKAKTGQAYPAKTTNSVLPKREKSGNNIVEADSISDSEEYDASREQSLAGLTAGKTNPWLLFFTAIAITIVSAAILIFIKKKTNVRT